jgi:ABC-type transporter Mla MlaB component
MTTGFSGMDKQDILDLDGKPATVISCGKVLGISTVNEFYLFLRQAFESELPIKIDASRVEQVDAAALQLLCAFVCDLAASGRKIQWSHPTPILISSAKLLQIHDLLALGGCELNATD